MILTEYLKLLRRGWWAIALAAVFGLGASLAYTLAQEPFYYSQATVYVSVDGSTSPGDLQQGAVFAVQRVSTYADLAMTSQVLDIAAAQLGGGTDADALRSDLTSVARLNTSLIDITVGGGDRAVVAAQANAVASALASVAPQLDAPGVASPVQLTIVQAAQTPTNAVTPRPGNNVVIGLLVGLVVGVVGVVVADALSSRIRTTNDLPRSVALATLTSLPSTGRRTRRAGEQDARQEAFRSLRANLQFGSHVDGTLAVSGVSAASDAQAVAQQLGAAFSETGVSVVLVDLDLRPESIGSRRGRDQAEDPPEGVVEALGGAPVEGLLRPVDGTSVLRLPPGRVDAAAAQRLGTPVVRDLLATLRSRFDYVILVTPPLLDRSEASVAAALAGSSLVVVESGKTKQSEFLYALELLAGVRVASVSVAIDHVRDLYSRSPRIPIDV